MRLPDFWTVFKLATYLCKKQCSSFLNFLRSHNYFLTSQAVDQPQNIICWNIHSKLIQVQCGYLDLFHMLCILEVLNIKSIDSIIRFLCKIIYGNINNKLVIKYCCDIHLFIFLYLFAHKSGNMPFGAFNQSIGELLSVHHIKSNKNLSCKSANVNICLLKTNNA